jgi:hypothetical protein
MIAGWWIRISHHHHQSILFTEKHASLTQQYVGLQEGHVIMQIKRKMNLINNYTPTPPHPTARTKK